MSAKRNAKVEITSSAAGMDRGLSEARRKMRAFQRDEERAAKRAAKEAADQAKRLRTGAAGGVRTIAGGLAAAAGFDLANDIKGAVQDVFAFEKQLTRFQIIAGKSPEAMAEFRNSIAAVSKETAKGREEVLAGAQAYVDLTGDVDGAISATRTMARVAQASDSSVADVATSMASLRDVMRVDPKDFEAVFSGLINQGKKGAVNLKDFAGELAGILPQFKEFGITGREGVNIMGAMFQVGRKGFGSAAETATGMQGLMGGLTKNAKRFRAAGVEIFNVGKDGTKTFKPLSEIIDAIGKSPLAKDPEALVKAFGRKEGMQFYRMLRDNVGELHELEEAGRDAGAVQRDLDTYMNSSAGKIESAWNKVKVAVAEALTPERIEAFASGAQKALGLIADSIAAIDHFLNGPSDKAASDKLAGDLANIAMGVDDRGIGKDNSIFGGNGLAGGDQVAAASTLAMGGNEMAAVNRAKAILAGDANLSGYGSVEAQRAGARKFLKSEGYDLTSWAAAGTANRQLSPTAANGPLADALIKSGGVDTMELAKAITEAVKQGFQNVQINLDGSRVNKGTNDSMQARKISGRGR